MKQLSRRPAIPHATQRELWARAAGRCQFRGCNVLLYKDDLTQHQSNLGIISHVVSFSPNGPRGDAVRSKQLERNIANLMLTCSKHGKLIDDKDLEAEYPETLLLAFKHEHETRVRRVTESTEDAQTHVLIIQAPIDGQDVYINPAAAHRAIQPKYPADEHPMIIDLSGTRLQAEGEAFFTLMAQSITEYMQPLLVRRPGTSRISSLSVFALAPIPLLIHVGVCLGEIAAINLYQYHRDQQDWMWKEEEEAQPFYEVLKPDEAMRGEQPVVLAFSISGLVSREQIARTLDYRPHIYEIRAREPGRDFLRSRKRLELFAYEVRNILVALHEAHHKRRPIHIFAALPAPMAVTFGRAIKSLDTPFVIYEYQKSDHAYVRALVINEP